MNPLEEVKEKMEARKLIARSNGCLLTAIELCEIERKYDIIHCQTQDVADKAQQYWTKVKEWILTI